jgi:DNA-binding transcriptional regulator YiaG
MPKRKKPSRRTRRRPEQLLKELEARVAHLRAQVRAGEGFSPDAVYAERERLELLAADYAELVGVFMLTIYNWEHGRSHPRAKQVRQWLAVKGIGKREAWRKMGYE